MISFFIGFYIGVNVGVFLLALLQAGKKGDTRDE